MPIQNDLTHLGKIVSKDNPLPTVSGNFISKFRESFEDYPNPFVWEEKRTNATDDIVIADGNCVGASYLVISKDPWSADSEITITSKQKFSLPLDLTVGLHASQRVFGQEMVVEVVDEELVPNFPVSLNITSFVHSTTAITITTQTAHNLAVGSRVQISGVPDSRFNYPALVVSAILTPNQVSLVGASGYTIPSINQTYNFSSAPYPQLGSRSALGGSQNGTSMILENATATNAAFFIRSEAGDVLPSGVVLGNHSVTTLSTASVQAAGNILGAYSFVPTTQYNLLMMGDRLQWTNSTIDAVTAASLLVNRTQVIPSLLKDYSLRFRVTNAKDITRPVAKITSIVKSGTTTATVTCDRPHGLNNLSRVTIYGVSDQAAASFPNLTTATDITAVTTNTFNVVIGTAATVSSFGGIVSVVHGNNLPSSLGYNPADQVSAALATSSVDSRKRVTLISAANWTLLSIGDYVNLAGFRSSTADLAIDGVYKIENINATFLVLLPLTSAFEASLPADFLTTNCGGQVIKRTDLRISYARFFDFARQRVEFVQRTGADAINALPVVLAANPTVTLTSTAVAGTIAVDTAIGNPVTVGLRASNANIAPMSATGDSVGWLGTMIGAGVVKPYALPEAGWSSTLSLTGTTDVAIQAAAGAGLKRHITAIQAINTGVTTELIIKDGTTERWRLTLPPNIPVSMEFPTELVTNANTALNAALSIAATSVRLNAQGYTAP
jgi:hypothetical protein